MLWRSPAGREGNALPSDLLASQMCQVDEEMHRSFRRPHNDLPLSVKSSAESVSRFYTMSLRRDGLLQRHYGLAAT